jgi:hypothetical protein
MPNRHPLDGDALRAAIAAKKAERTAAGWEELERTESPRRRMVGGVVEGEDPAYVLDRTCRIAEALIRSGCLVEVVPLPDAGFEVSVREDMERSLLIALHKS